LSNTQQLIDKFRQADVITYPDIAKLDYALDAGLWLLWVYSETIDKDRYLNTEQISEILASVYGISFDEREITNAFNRADKKIHRKEIDEKMSFKIMTKGIEHLHKKMGVTDVEVYYIEGEKPRKSHAMLKDVISKTKGITKILDPYYGVRTLDMLEKLDHGVEIRFLTSKIGQNESTQKFARELEQFKREHQNITLNRYSKVNELHDRYIITEDTLIILGNGIKDLGGKESFVLVFKDDKGKDIRSALNQKFNDRWSDSSPLQ
jgi:hypothetical protein